jgi:hypothetical protein
MTVEELNKHWTARKQQLRRMADEVRRFKQCEECRSILDRDWGVCPVCKSYRFETDPEVLRRSMCEMEQRPYPASAPVLPRFEH